MAMFGIALVLFRTSCHSLVLAPKEGGDILGIFDAMFDTTEHYGKNEGFKGRSYEGWSPFGEKIIHEDASGRKVGESYTNQGIFGERTDFYDKNRRSASSFSGLFDQD